MADIITIPWVASGDGNIDNARSYFDVLKLRNQNLNLELLIMPHGGSALKPEVSITSVEYPIIIINYNIIGVGLNIKKTGRKRGDFCKFLIKKAKNEDSDNKDTPIIVTDIEPGESYQDQGNIIEPLKKLGAVDYFCRNPLTKEGSQESFSDLVMSYLQHRIE